MGTGLFQLAILEKEPNLSPLSIFEAHVIEDYPFLWIEALNGSNIIFYFSKVRLVLCCHKDCIEHFMLTWPV